MSAFIKFSILHQAQHVYEKGLSQGK